MKKYILNLLNSDGKLSSKRFITLFAFFMMCVGFTANLFWAFNVEEHMFRSMEMIVEIGMGTIVAEKFGKKREPNEPTSQEQVDGIISSTEK
jgi:hypothetical protein